MWKIVRNVNPIWFFDATGNIHRDINRQKKPFFYSLVCHDTNVKSIIPVAEFLSTANDQNTITKYLSEILTIFQKSTTRDLLPNIIVTDHSWALINSVLKCFNSCDINLYINWCYEQIVRKNTESDSPKVILYLCSTHFLKNMIKKSNQAVGKKNGKAFIFMFVLIQNSIKIEQIDVYLKHIHTILHHERINCKLIIENFNIILIISVKNFNFFKPLF